MKLPKSPFSKNQKMIEVWGNCSFVCGQSLVEGSGGHPELKTETCSEYKSEIPPQGNSQHTRPQGLSQSPGC